MKSYWKVMPDLLNPRRRSLLRGNLLVVLSFLVALVLADFPRNRANPLLGVVLLTAAIGTVDTVRCMRPKWSWYHGGVLLCVYMDLMILSMLLFFFLYPYATWLSGTH